LKIHSLIGPTLIGKDILNKEITLKELFHLLKTTALNNSHGEVINLSKMEEEEESCSHLEKADSDCLW